MKKQPKKLVNHKLYCGKLYARIGGQFKEIDLKPWQLGVMAKERPPIVNIGFDGTFTCVGQEWHLEEATTESSNCDFDRLFIKAIGKGGK